MASNPSPAPRFCPNCGTVVPPSATVCGNCGTSVGPQRAPLAPRNGGRKEWGKRLGPVGVVLAFLAKFKTLGFLLLAKGKFLLIGLTKIKVLLSLFAFFGLYWALYGWWFAIGMVGSIAMHEMGHYIAARRLGYAAELPMFVPGLGAYVRWGGINVDLPTRAQIALAGPFFGFLSGILALGLFYSTGGGVWLAVAHFAGWINLLNLIPVSIFDGGSALNAMGRQERMALLIVSLAMWFLLGEFMFLFVAIGAGYRIWKRDFPPQSSHAVSYGFIGLAIANGLLSAYTMSLAHGLFGR